MSPAFQELIDAGEMVQIGLDADGQPLYQSRAAAHSKVPSTSSDPYARRSNVRREFSEGAALRFLVRNTHVNRPFEWSHN